MNSTSTARNPRPPLPCSSAVGNLATSARHHASPAARRVLGRAMAGTALIAASVGVVGCIPTGYAQRDADRAAYDIIEQKQLAALGRNEPFTISIPEDTLRRRLLLDQKLPAAGPASFGRAYLPPVPKQPDGVSRGPAALVTANIVNGPTARTPGVHRPNLSTDIFLFQLGPSGTVRTFIAEPPGIGVTLGPADPSVDNAEIEPLRITLLDALKLGARSSRDYQDQKEEVYLTALDLDLERDQFEFQFSGLFDANFQSELEGDDTAGVSLSPRLGISKLFKSGALITARIGLDLAKLLTGDEEESLGLLADASITIPLLRGAGVEVVTESLQQAERDTIYAIWDFERFKRVFAVDVIDRYYNVLQGLDQISNARGTYERLRENTRRSQALVDAGRLEAVQLLEIQANELQAYSRLIQTEQQYEQQLDQFKIFLGLPPDASITLDAAELDALSPLATRVLGPTASVDFDAELGPATQPSSQPSTQPDPNVVEEPTPDPTRLEPTASQVPDATTRPTTRPTTSPTTGPTTRAEVDDLSDVPDVDEVDRRLGRDSDGGDESDSRLDSAYAQVDVLYRDAAIRIALENRLDLAGTQGAVVDAQRGVVVAADGLRGVFDLNAGGNIGGGRGSLSGASANSNLRFDEGSYSAGLGIELPIERTAERNQYRNALIGLDRAVRSAQAAEDGVKLDVISALRDLRVAAEDLKVQSVSIEIAIRRRDLANELLELGRGQVRDVTEAEADLTDALNSFTSTLIDFRIAELELQRDLGVLQVDDEGLYTETALFATEPQTP